MSQFHPDLQSAAFVHQRYEDAALVIFQRHQKTLNRESSYSHRHSSGSPTSIAASHYGNEAFVHLATIESNENFTNSGSKSFEFTDLNRSNQASFISYTEGDRKRFFDEDLPNDHNKPRASLSISYTEGYDNRKGKGGGIPFIDSPVSPSVDATIDPDIGHGHSKYREPLENTEVDSVFVSPRNSEVFNVSVDRETEVIVESPRHTIQYKPDLHLHKDSLIIQEQDILVKSIGFKSHILDNDLNDTSDKFDNDNHLTEPDTDFEYDIPNDTLTDNLQVKISPDPISDIDVLSVSPTKRNETEELDVDYEEAFESAVDNLTKEAVINKEISTSVADKRLLSIEECEKLIDNLVNFVEDTHFSDSKSGSETPEEKRIDKEENSRLFELTSNKLQNDDSISLSSEIVDVNKVEPDVELKIVEDFEIEANGDINGDTNNDLNTPLFIDDKALEEIDELNVESKSIVSANKRATSANVETKLRKRSLIQATISSQAKLASKTRPESAGVLGQKDRKGIVTSVSFDRYKRTSVSEDNKVSRPRQRVSISAIPVAQENKQRTSDSKLRSSSLSDKHPDIEKLKSVQTLENKERLKSVNTEGKDQIKSEQTDSVRSISALQNRDKLKSNSSEHKSKSVDISEKGKRKSTPPLTKEKSKPTTVDTREKTRSYSIPSETKDRPKSLATRPNSKSSESSRTSSVTSSGGLSRSGLTTKTVTSTKEHPTKQNSGSIPVAKPKYQKTRPGPISQSFSVKTKPAELKPKVKPKVPPRSVSLVKRAGRTENGKNPTSTNSERISSITLNKLHNTPEPSDASQSVLSIIKSIEKDTPTRVKKSPTKDLDTLNRVQSRLCELM